MVTSNFSIGRFRITISIKNNHPQLADDEITRQLTQQSSNGVLIFGQPLLYHYKYRGERKQRRTKNERKETGKGQTAY